MCIKSLQLPLHLIELLKFEKKVQNVISAKSKIANISEMSLKKTINLHENTLLCKSLKPENTYNNNNNNGKTMFMVLSSWPIATARVHPVHLDECRSVRRAAADPPTKPINLGLESACIGCDMTYIHHRHFIITQPESWYSFYRPMEGGRLSQPRHTACSGFCSPI